MAVKANEVSQAELLERDVKILFDENRRLRAENEKLGKENELLEHDLYYTKRRVTELKNYIDDMENDEKQELAEYLTHQRAALGFTYRQFAKVIGVNHASVPNYECGKGTLKNMRKAVDNLKRFRKAK
jgi:DNA-binding transcriptional regulator YiaG